MAAAKAPAKTPTKAPAKRAPRKAPARPPVEVTTRDDAPDTAGEPPAEVTTETVTVEAPAATGDPRGYLGQDASDLAGVGDGIDTPSVDLKPSEVRRRPADDELHGGHVNDPTVHKVAGSRG